MSSPTALFGTYRRSSRAERISSLTRGSGYVEKNPTLATVAPIVRRSGSSALLAAGAANRSANFLIRRRRASLLLRSIASFCAASAADAATVGIPPPPAPPPSIIPSSSVVCPSSASSIAVLSVGSCGPPAPAPAPPPPAADSARAASWNSLINTSASGPRARCSTPCFSRALACRFAAAARACFLASGSRAACRLACARSALTSSSPLSTASAYAVAFCILNWSTAPYLSSSATKSRLGAPVSRVARCKGVSRCTFSQFGSAPFSSKNTATSSQPLPVATCSGVIRSAKSEQFTSAPPVTSIVTHSIDPSSHARCSGVRPVSTSVTLGSAPRLSSKCRIRGCFWVTAS
eukprot:comp21698_c0_seq2/m.48264 comp21698_c0_seq2/g.48264  ORF comp21698_c0_seq2/g.48264 comp21698_c0_seq2/m.48264 type:complete len:349 (+) comp21698_c0_seq2:367-1413(+)